MYNLISVERNSIKVDLIMKIKVKLSIRIYMRSTIDTQNVAMW